MQPRSPATCQRYPSFAPTDRPHHGWCVSPCSPSLRPHPTLSRVVPFSATYFYQNGVAGACGRVHSDYDLICAMGTPRLVRAALDYDLSDRARADYRRYGDTSVRSSLCGRSVRITNTQNGKSVNAFVADACPTCENGNSIDLSMGAFQRIADLSEGVVPSASICLAFPSFASDPRALQSHGSLTKSSIPFSGRCLSYIHSFTQPSLSSSRSPTHTGLDPWAVDSVTPDFLTVVVVHSLHALFHHGHHL